jgi:amidase
MNAAPELTSASASELATLIGSRKVSALEVLDEHLRRIERVNPVVNAVVRIDAERARERARQADAALARGESWGALHGVPFTLKDMHEAAGFGASVGTKASESMPARDGVVAERLQAAGAILFGKTNMSNSLQTISEQFGRASNPYDLSRTTGGSSGGAAAAIAARLSSFDVGTDLSGSIRMPSHFCGVFGLRPTMHRIPAAGMVFGPAGGPRMDRVLGTAGPMARSARDIDLLFRVLAGPDPRDTEVAPVPVAAPRKVDVRGLRVAIAPSIAGMRTARDIRGALEALAAKLSDAGAVVEEREPCVFSELLSAFRRYFVVPISMAIRAGIVPPGAVPAGLRAEDFPQPTPFDVATALDERDRFIQIAGRFFSEYDVFVCPAATAMAFPHTAPGSPVDIDGELVPSLAVDHPTILSTFTGGPSLVVPVALSARGLPIGAQLVGPRWSDERLVAIGSAVADVAGPLPAPSSLT